MPTTDAASDSGFARALRRDAAHAAARRYLSSLAGEDTPDLPTGEMCERLQRCRELLAAVVETSRPHEPLARTVDEAAAALGVSPLAVYRLVHSGDLTAYRISGRFIRIDEAELRSYLDRNTIGFDRITDSDIPEWHIQPTWVCQG